jgi:small-conductance mechanosensitive channel
MQDHVTEQELKDRLSLIESMIAEGRRHTESWGWTFVLWGVVYYIAIAWSVWGHSAWAWPASILVGVIATGVVASSKSGNHPETALGRAVGSIWLALGISMCVLFPALGISGRLSDPHVFVAAISAILGMANGASALILRWKVQFACAVVWWAAAVAACFGSEAQSIIVFLVAIFLCQIVFGIYGMIAEAQERKPRVPIHA